MEKSGKKFTIGYQNRFRTDAQALKRACEEGKLGDIYFAKAHAIRRRAVPTWGVFPDKSKQGGGPLIDIGTHALDITLWCMDNYEPETITGSVFEKLGHLPEATEGNMFGPWDPETYEVEDSAFGYIKMKNGATIFLESSWALNVKDSREAATTLCGTKAGAEMVGGMSGQSYDLIFNETTGGILTEEHISDTGAIAFFEGKGGGSPAEKECKQWLEAILEDKEPLVKPEQAFVVTEILILFTRQRQQAMRSDWIKLIRRRKLCISIIEKVPREGLHYIVILPSTAFQKIWKTVWKICMTWELTA